MIEQNKNINFKCPDCKNNDVELYRGYRDNVCELKAYIYCPKCKNTFKLKVEYPIVNYDQIKIEKIEMLKISRSYNDEEIRKEITEKGIDKVDWLEISIERKLSESFIREYKDYVNWHFISLYQTLSENFVEEFKDKLSD